MPRSKKAAGTAVDARNGRRAELEVQGDILEVALPRPREEYQRLALEAWDGFWSNAVAATVTAADLMIVYVWINAYDDYLGKKAEADRRPIVTGSMGQEVANPLYGVAKDALNLAMACARQLGIGARNRADLGIAIWTGKEKLNQANAAYQDPEEQDDGDDDDPRTVPGETG